jgi:hypothetical protein
LSREQISHTSQNTQYRSRQQQLPSPEKPRQGWRFI